MRRAPMLQARRTNRGEYSDIFVGLDVAKDQHAVGAVNRQPQHVLLAALFRHTHLNRGNLFLKVLPGDLAK